VNFIDVVFASLLANNLLVFHFFGLGEFLQDPNAVAVGRRTGILGLLLVVSTAAYWSVDHFLLIPFHLEVLRTILLFGVLALVTTVYGTLVGTNPGPWPQAREFLVHSFLVGAVVLVGSSAGDLLEMLTASVAVTLGYGGALVVLAAVFSRLARERIPAFLQGLPLHLVTLGLIWLVLQGLGLAFSGKVS